MSSESTGKPFRKTFEKSSSFKGSKFGPNNGKKRFKSTKKPNNRFMANAKSFGRKGNYGRGTHIEEEQFTYFIGILSEVQKPIDSAEDRVSMANNVFEQTKDKEIHLASNQVVSKTIEALIGFTDPEHLERFFNAFAENFRPICSDKFASHVLQKMIEIAFIRAVGQNIIKEEKEVEENGIQAKRAKLEFINDLKYNLSTEFSDEHRDKCSEFVQRISKFLLNNLEDFVWDSCASHLIRACIMSLAGVHIPKDVPAKGKSSDNEDKFGGSKAGHHKGVLELRKTIFQVPTEWTELMKEFPSRLEMWPQFSELPYKEKSSGLVGVICVAFSHVDSSGLKHFGKKLLHKAFVDVDVPEEQCIGKAPFKAESEEENEEEGRNEDASDDEEKEEAKQSDENGKEKSAESEKDDLPSVFKTESSTRLLETLLSVGGAKLLTEIYNTLFAGRIVNLANDRRTNFPLQKLLNYIKDKSVFELIFDVLVEHFENFLVIGNIGILSAISGACLRLNTKQAAFITALQAGLHCTTAFGADRPKSFFTCLLKMKPVEELQYDKSNYVALYGSLIIQDILQYNKPIFLVNCILETPPSDLVLVLQLANGCYIADVFLKSKFIGEKSREKFVKLLEGFYMDLALERFGSRVLEKVFDAANEGQKLRIAKELTTKENKMKGTLFGRIIFNVLRLETFKLSPDQWKASWTAKPNKGEDMLNKIVKKKRAAS